VAAPVSPAPTDPSSRIGSLTQLFGFARFEIAGTLAVADGRYVVRDGNGERVLVLETLGAPGPPRRRRRRSRQAQADEPPATLPLARATAVRASEPFADERQATAWLDAATGDEAEADRLVAEGLATLNRALHAHAVASGDWHVQALAPSQAVTILLGYGSGEQVASGEFTAARAIEGRAGAASKRQRRAEELRPQERVAAVLGGRQHLDACETLLLRARADLDAGREREAALQLRVGLEALLAELPGALSDSGHLEDMATLEDRRGAAGELANAALRGALDKTQVTALGELLATSERVLRRRRVLGG